MWVRAAALSVMSLGVFGCGRVSPTFEQSPSPTTSASPLPSIPSTEPPFAESDTALAPPSSDWLPRPYRARGKAAVTDNAECVRCHESAAKQHAGSAHQRATVNPAFRAALRLEPTPFCRGCHAPEADPRHDTPAALRDLGVGCVTCHTDDAGTVYAAPRADRPAEEASIAHTIVRSVAFAGPGACAGCHEFRFDSPGGDEDEHHMQTTVREHARGPLADTSCAECHMPKDEGGKHDHWFRGVRDPAFLRASLTATAEPLAEPGVRLTLTQTLPGHAFPTGDLFRRLEVGVAITDAQGRVLAKEVKHLARHLVIVPRQHGRKLVGDDRVFAEPRVVELFVSRPQRSASVGPLRLSWWVTYQRPATVGDGLDPRRVKIESSVLLHRGVVVWSAEAAAERLRRRGVIDRWSGRRSSWAGRQLRAGQEVSGNLRRRLMGTPG